MLIAHFHLYKGHIGTTVLQGTSLLQTTDDGRGIWRGYLLFLIF